jgi:iron complex transport system substrate-binding protein
MARTLRSVVLGALAIALATTISIPAGAHKEGVARVVSLSPSATEMLFAVGAGDQVVAVDDQSDFPEGVPTTDLSGYTPNVEAIASYDPDLVVVPDDQVVDQLADLGIDTLVLPAALELSDAFTQLRKVGKATGHANGARLIIKDMKKDIRELVAQVPDGNPRPTAFYELDDTYFSADSSTFIGELLDLGGFDNIADEAQSDGSGYPQLSVEFVIDSDPDVIFLADSECCGQTAEVISQRPGFSDLQAVKNGNIVEVGDDLASRWGPRLVELLQVIVEARTSL